MKFNVDNADGLLQGMRGNMRKLVKGEKRKIQWQRLAASSDRMQSSYVKQ